MFRLLKPLCVVLTVLMTFASISAATAGQKYKSRWDQVGGSWTTGWVRNHPERICGAGAHCVCNGQNLCGKYKNGQSTYWWPRGCQARPMKIQCTSVPQ
ncbi:MAG: hypothetical protein JKY49_00160 [Cohaesibacteraceae bacterium]|nr:hypothetical protein [Cohaesibacteraceae bacterium]